MSCRQAPVVSLQNFPPLFWRSKLLLTFYSDTAPPGHCVSQIVFVSDNMHNKCSQGIQDRSMKLKASILLRGETQYCLTRGITSTPTDILAFNFGCVCVMAASCVLCSVGHTSDSVHPMKTLIVLHLLRIKNFWRDEFKCCLAFSLLHTEPITS